MLWVVKWVVILMLLFAVRMLNTSKGPAVHALRAQADKYNINEKWLLFYIIKKSILKEFW